MTMATVSRNGERVVTELSVKNWFTAYRHGCRGVVLFCLTYHSRLVIMPKATHSLEVRSCTKSQQSLQKMVTFYSIYGWFCGLLFVNNMNVLFFRSNSFVMKREFGDRRNVFFIQRLKCVVPLYPILNLGEVRNTDALLRLRTLDNILLSALNWNIWKT